MTKSFGWIFKSVLRGNVSFGGLKGYQNIPLSPFKRMVFTTNKKYPLKFLAITL
ncbi:hypothetical protein HMPREF1451_00756 [Helicobacter pylori HP260BFii]|uniref:Uncharacterized protein n=1 Tax=Helicobacter pylori GAM260BSi TaxID=1159046 RepID=M3PPY8_HELPX|nr:hypothetical protein HMPREF1418_01522 [Helicobacter pylori GAM260BSi]EMH68466.1 hypothetical protein HMPREF1451_00756 [Helicobacter pylori HP260BFii]